MPKELDQFDRKILVLLQERGDMPLAEISEKVGLSQTPCWNSLGKPKPF